MACKVSRGGPAPGEHQHTAGAEQRWHRTRIDHQPLTASWLPPRRTKPSWHYSHAAAHLCLVRKGTCRIASKACKVCGAAGADADHRGAFQRHAQLALPEVAPPVDGLGGRLVDVAGVENLRGNRVAGTVSAFIKPAPLHACCQSKCLDSRTVTFAAWWMHTQLPEARMLQRLCPKPALALAPSTTGGRRCAAPALPWRIAAAPPLVLPAAAKEPAASCRRLLRAAGGRQMLGRSAWRRSSNLERCSGISGAHTFPTAHSRKHAARPALTARSGSSRLPSNCCSQPKQAQ